MSRFRAHMKNAGFAHLVGVILVSLVGTSVAITLLSVGVSRSENQGALYGMYQALAAADACADIALLALKNDPLYEGSGAYDAGEIQCSADTANVESGADREFRIESTAISGEYVKNLLITGAVASGTAPVILEWREVPEF